MKLPFGLSIVRSAALAVALPIVASAVDEAVSGLHARYGDDLKAISGGLLTDTSKTGDEKAEIVIAALVTAAAKDGVGVVYALAKAVAQRVYLDVASDAAQAANAVLARLRAL